MTTINPAQTDQQPAGAPRDFSAILLPHRSLSRKGFFLLMAIIVAVSAIAGAVFLAMGAWPVTGVFGLDAILIYLAFKLNYRAARLFERVELDETELKVTRVHPSGKSESWSFNPYWVKLELEERETTADIMRLRVRERSLVFGSFLTDSEKKDFAAALNTALAARRNA